MTFRPGETVKVLTVVITGDRRREPNETFTVRLTSPTGASPSPPNPGRNPPAPEG